MSLPIWQATIVNEFGDIIPSATITVKDEATGLGLTVYSDRNGTSALGTNGVFTAGADGFAQFFAPAGNYSINAKQPINGFEKTFDFVVLTGTAATKDTQVSPVDTTAGRILITDALDSDGNVWGAANVEYGINANGEYWKYPDGLLICIQVEDVQLILGPSVYPVESLPHAFVNTSYSCSLAFSASISSLSTGKVGIQPNSSGSYVFALDAADTSIKTLRFTFVGRWK